MSVDHGMENPRVTALSAAPQDAPHPDARRGSARPPNGPAARDHVLGRQVDRGLGPAAVHPHDHAVGCQDPVDLVGEQEAVDQHDGVGGAVGEREPGAVGQDAAPDAGGACRSISRETSTASTATPGR